MPRSPRTSAVEVLAASTAPFLVLLAPIVRYVQYQHYGFGNPEVAVFLLLVAALAVLLGAGSAVSMPFRVATLAGLLVFLVDIQSREPGLKKLGLLFLGACAVLWVLRRHASGIVSAMMLTLVVSIVVLPGPLEAVTSTVGSKKTPPAGRGDPPLVVHLLLDEFIGAEGLPADLTPPGFKHDLERFFVDRGFRIFDRAYSEYPVTVWSVPHLLNLAPGRYNPNLTEPEGTGDSWRLTRNAYFDRLADLGYAITVHQSDDLDLCPNETSASCRTYPTTSLNVIKRLDVPLSGRLSIIAGSLLGRSEIYTRAKSKYQGIRRRLAGKVTLPAWEWDQRIPTSAASMQILDAVADDLSKATRGTAVFAHVLMPHYPYVYDAGCRQQPASGWMERSDPEHADVAGGIINVPESRAARYSAYLQQVACTERQIDRLLEAIPASLRGDAVIIVQGDHGSRITMVDPTTAAPVALATSDYADAFSTMFAVRSSGIRAGDDPHAAPITCLLSALVESRFNSTAGLEACAPSQHTVYFMAGGQPPVPRQLPDFWTATSAALQAAPTAGGLRQAGSGPVATRIR